MDIFLKLLIGFAVFFVGVILNVWIMHKFEGRKAEGFLPMLSFILICAGLVILVVMANVIPVNIEETGAGAPPAAAGFGNWR